MDEEDYTDDAGALAAATKDADQWSAMLSQRQEGLQKAISDRAQVYDQYADELRQRRVGPDKGDLMLALSQALAQPTRYKGFGAMMENITPAFTQHFAAQKTAEDARRDLLTKYGLQRADADVETASALAKLQAQYDVARMKARAAANKPRPGFNPITGELIDMNTGQPVGANAPVVVNTKEEALALPPGTRFIAATDRSRTVRTR